MPSPFPGMDPFLEDPEIFPNLHHDLITFLQGTLKSLLPRPYFAAVSTRVWVELGRRAVEPDVDVLHKNQPRAQREDRGKGVALLTAPDTHPILIEVPEEEVTEAYLNVYARKEKEEL